MTRIQLYELAVEAAKTSMKNPEATKSDVDISIAQAAQAGAVADVDYDTFKADVMGTRNRYAQMQRERLQSEVIAQAKVAQVPSAQKV
jgi:hypothetical protein